VVCWTFALSCNGLELDNCNLALGDRFYQHHDNCRVATLGVNVNNGNAFVSTFPIVWYRKHLPKCIIMADNYSYCSNIVGDRRPFIFVRTRQVHALRKQANKKSKPNNNLLQPTINLY
jgi:hypothetical protein